MTIINLQPAIDKKISLANEQLNDKMWLGSQLIFLNKTPQDIATELRCSKNLVIDYINQHEIILQNL